MKIRVLLSALSVVAVAAVAAPRVAPADGSRVALGGFCPVAYVEVGKPIYGEAKYSATYEGHTYHFVDAEALALFKANPTKYADAIRYDAWCPTALAVGQWSPSDPEQYVIRDGKVYLFTNAEAKAMFEKDPAGTIAKADANWKVMHAGAKDMKSGMKADMKSGMKADTKKDAKKGM